MNDALLVSGFEGLGNLPGDGQRFVDGNRPEANAVSKRVSVHELQREGMDPVALLEAVDARDVRVIEGREHPGFALETRDSLGVCGEHLGQDLQRHTALQPGILRQLDLAHAAGPDHVHDLVRADSSAWADTHFLEVGALYGSAPSASADWLISAATHLLALPSHPRGR